MSTSSLQRAPDPQLVSCPNGLTHHWFAHIQSVFFIPCIITLSCCVQRLFVSLGVSGGAGRIFGILWFVGRERKAPADAKPFKVY